MSVKGTLPKALVVVVLVDEDDTLRKGSQSRGCGKPEDDGEPLA